VGCNAGYFSIKMKQRVIEQSEIRCRCLGLGYHLRYPLLILDYLARITSEKPYFQRIVTDANAKRDLVIPENLTAANYDLFHDPDFPKMCFVENNLEDAYNNWFVCNTSGICAVLRSSGFTNITRAGGDCFVCNPPDRDARPKISHILTGLREVR
jgi:hypothetical protein